MKLIEITSDKVGGGLSGSYFRISEDRGVKLFYNTYFNSPTEAVEHLSTHYQDQYSDAHYVWKECQIYKHLAGTGLTPKFYGECILLKGGKYFLGFEIEHCDGGTLSSSSLLTDEKVRIERNLIMQLDRAGVEYRDEHWGNVVKSGDTWYMIDFAFCVLKIQGGMK